jgi:hypothetical protein
VQFAPFEKFEYLVRGQRIFAHGKDYRSIGGLHRETHSHPVLPQKVDGPYNVVRFFRVIAHDKLSWLRLFSKRLFPPKDRFGRDQGWPMIFGTVAHGEGISVCKVIRDISIIGKRNMRACFCQAYVKSVILFVAMREETNCRFGASADDGEQHGIPPNGPP